MLIATKISDLIGQWATRRASRHLLGWGAAAVVRIATDSATVATITGARIMAPIVLANQAVNKELMVLAVGSGSIILSHVNDVGPARRSTDMSVRLREDGHKLLKTTWIIWLNASSAKLTFSGSLNM